MCTNNCLKSVHVHFYCVFYFIFYIFHEQFTIRYIIHVLTYLPISARYLIPSNIYYVILYATIDDVPIDGNNSIE